MFMRKNQETFGSKRDRYYSTYYGIHSRCRNPNHAAYPNYGGRGITCFWDNADDFRTYILEELGPRPKNKELDRIDNDGNYEPGNLRWATRKQQQANTRQKKK